MVLLSVRGMLVFFFVVGRELIFFGFNRIFVMRRELSFGYRVV